MRWLPLPQPYTRASAEWFIGTFGPAQRESGAGIVFAIESGGKLAGAIDLKHVNWASKVAEVGYWVAPGLAAAELPPTRHVSSPCGQSATTASNGSRCLPQQGT